VKSLPEIENATNTQLKQGLQNHLSENETHLARLEQVFQMPGKDVQGVDCPAIDGIIEEAEGVSGEVADKDESWTLRSLPPVRPSSTTKSPATAH